MWMIAVVVVTGLVTLGLGWAGGRAWASPRAWDRGYDEGYDAGRSDGYDTGKAGKLPGLAADDLCAGCRSFAHCDGASPECICTCTWPEDWADEPLVPLPDRLPDAGTLTRMYADLGPGDRCRACGATGCPAAGKPYVDDCPRWQEAEARRDRGEYLPTEPVWPVGVIAWPAAEHERVPTTGEQRAARTPAWQAQLDEAHAWYEETFATGQFRAVSR
jgi:hypothetical protein